MSELILPSNTPNFQTDRETAQWLNGKISRKEVVEQMSTIESKVQHLTMELQRLASTISKVYVMTRTIGLQLDTVNYLLDSAAPGWEAKYDAEFKKTVEMVTFIDTINPNGPQADMPMKAKIEEVRAWNAKENVKKIEGDHFLLGSYIKAHPTEFTKEEVDALNVEFNMKVVLPETPPVVKVDSDEVAAAAVTLGETNDGQNISS